MNQSSKGRLLIIEDDKANVKFLEAYLNRYFEVSICDSDITFYEKIENQKYDLILMDISINGSKSGLDLTRELKENPERADIPVVCYTAHALQKDRVNAMNAGCDLFLRKPIDNKTLLGALQQFLANRELALNT